MNFSVTVMSGTSLRKNTYMLASDSGKLIYQGFSFREMEVKLFQYIATAKV